MTAAATADNGVGRRGTISSLNLMCNRVLNEVINERLMLNQCQILYVIFAKLWLTSWKTVARPKDNFQKKLSITDPPFTFC